MLHIIMYNPATSASKEYADLNTDKYTLDELYDICDRKREEDLNTPSDPAECREYNHYYVVDDEEE